MDSLLASYASSDEEEEEDNPNPSFSLPKSSLFSSLPNPNSPQTLTLISPPNPNFQTHKQKLDKPTSLFSSLPKPNSSISQFSLPPPKSNPSETLISPPNPNFQTQDQILDKPTSLFSFLPQPKSSSSQFSLLPPPNPKKIVQVKLPVMKPSKFDDDDEEDDVIEREGRKTKSFAQSTSALSFLSSLPEAKNSSSTLGALPSALGSGRKSIIETNVPSSNSTSFSTEAQVGVGSNEVNYDGSSINSEYGVSGVGNYESYDGNAGYGNYDYYQQYDNNWGDGSAEVAQSSLGGVDESVMKVPGKRGRNEIPTNIVEVKQDELIKNRPREDQVKSTGIAFGPAYQPVSTKGKPSKLQKRKHQIGSLYFDMRQKESELAERRSKGFLTKAETQAKYGW